MESMMIQSTYEHYQNTTNIENIVNEEENISNDEITTDGNNMNQNRILGCTDFNAGIDIQVNV